MTTTSADAPQAETSAKPSMARYRALYVGVMLAFLAGLWWTGRGPATTLDAYQKVVASSLRRAFPDTKFENLAEGTMLASGGGVFAFFDLRADWDEIASKDKASRQEAAKRIADRVLFLRDEAKAFAEDANRANRMAAMAVPIASFHRLMSPILASRALAIRRQGDVPAFVFFRSSTGEWLPLEASLAKSGALGPSIDALVDAAIANADAAEWKFAESPEWPDAKRIEAPDDVELPDLAAIFAAATLNRARAARGEGREELLVAYGPCSAWMAPATSLEQIGARRIAPRAEVDWPEGAAFRLMEDGSGWELAKKLP